MAKFTWIFPLKMSWFEFCTLPFLASCNCLMTSSRSAASVAVVTRKEPSRVKVVRLASKVAVTPHSFSRFCFRSKHAANAQPTAWLSRSPWGRKTGQTGVFRSCLHLSDRDCSYLLHNIHQFTNLTTNTVMDKLVSPLHLTCFRNWSTQS